MITRANVPQRYFPTARPGRHVSIGIRHGQSALDNVCVCSDVVVASVVQRPATAATAAAIVASIAAPSSPVGASISSEAKAISATPGVHQRPVSGFSCVLLLLLLLLLDGVSLGAARWRKAALGLQREERDGCVWSRDCLRCSDSDIDAVRALVRPAGLCSPIGALLPSLPRRRLDARMAALVGAAGRC